MAKQKSKNQKAPNQKPKSNKAPKQNSKIAKKQKRIKNANFEKILPHLR